MLAESGAAAWVQRQPLQQHPAWQRFRSKNDGRRQVLLIHAPPGTGRRLFARSWAAEERVHDCSTLSDDDIVAIATKAHDSGEAHAIITPSRATVWAVAEVVPCLFADAADLMLSRDEIFSCRPAATISGHAMADTIYRVCGGWYEAVRRFHLDPDDTEGAYAVLAGSLIPWLRMHGDALDWYQIALLPVIDEDVLDALKRESSGSGLTLRELRSSGIARPDPEGAWFVPALVRQAIEDWAGARHPGEVGRRGDVVVAALAESGEMDHAIGAAFHTRAWGSLRTLMFDRWAEMFTSNPQQLFRVAARFPRRLKDRTDGFAVALRVLGAAGRERMNLPLPSFRPDYDNDATAHQLRARVEYLNRRPNSHALTVGLIELGHLRLSAHFSESADAARRLRVTLDRALGAHQIRPSLAALTEIQAGISLHLADHATEAQHAYESARHWAVSADHPFLQANATANLASLAGHRGDTESLRHWLGEHDLVAQRVGWGRRMVGRTADLARGQLAVAELDSATLNQVLADLPTQLDNDEFWPVHLSLIGMAQILNGDAEGARACVEATRAERTHAACSDLARRLFDTTTHFAKLVTSSSDRDESRAQWPEFVAIDAVKHLRDGHPDLALALIGPLMSTAIQPRQRNPLLHLSVLARNGGALDGPATSEIRQTHQSSGELIDLVPLHLLGHSEALALAGLISPEHCERLNVIRVPPRGGANRARLTERELDVLHRLRQGLNRREIAETSHRSENTVKSQIRTLFRKLDAGSTAEALEIARRHGY
ncbi:LuxR C-terminal-related transcriptional regulator [Homoserinimonas sp. OAct 916]|uniref:helix-turn-helix transcriptional regulator n=1 Tax=Homoserinimonas sp. OAct 916 TaxID=2211450 RepID=UPI001300490B|nr:LuxR C-terminal-related transcriptional regulator [Homoserinimonas sp. OAct 916]